MADHCDPRPRRGPNPFAAHRLPAAIPPPPPCVYTNKFPPCVTCAVSHYLTYRRRHIKFSLSHGVGGVAAGGRRAADECTAAPVGAGDSCSPTKEAASRLRKRRRPAIRGRPCAIGVGGGGRQSASRGVYCQARTFQSISSTLTAKQSCAPHLSIRGFQSSPIVNNDIVV